MKMILKKVRVHNLKGVDLELRPGQLIVFTGVSGSGKSSLAFDTIFIEGQRRYIESLSTYARRHLGDLPKPEAEVISGISPTIAIEQKSAGKNPRSTMGTMTAIYDYLRVLYARAGDPHCPVSGERVFPRSPVQIVHEIESLPKGSRLSILAPYAKGKKGEFKEEFTELVRRGFTRIRLDGKVVDLSEELSIDGEASHDVDVVIDRLLLPDERLKESVASALEIGKGVMSVLLHETEQEILFSQHAYAFKSKTSYPPLEPHDFSFNHPSGMCPACEGLGVLQEFQIDKIIDPELSISENCCSIAPRYETVRFGNIYDNLARMQNFSVKTPWKKLSEKARRLFLYGTDTKWTRMTFVHPEKKTRWIDYVQWRGVLHEAKTRYAEATSDLYRAKMQTLMEESLCSSCQGSRIKPYPAATLFQGKKIAEVTAMTVADCLAFFEKAAITPISEELLKEIVQRLRFLMGVGLHYLSLERSAPTLSGGESQRVRLASQIGSGLVGTTYVLDEPSIGLHPRDNARLLETLFLLRDRGNTVIVVEHDEETIRLADHIVDVGPLAGKEGGEIIVSGTFADLLSEPRSVTGAFLSGKEKIPIPKKRRKPSKAKITVQGASHHNLKNIDVSVPLGLFVAVTGVSGSGKSSLITDILYPALSNHLHRSDLSVGKHKALKGIEAIDKVIAIDQTPIGRTPRSNPATYIKLFDDIRDLFSQLPEAQAAGFKAGRFSFNVKEGSCPHCGGMGMIKIDMDFLEDEWVVCEHCKGKRFDEKTLSVLYKGKNIHEVLEMTVETALEFFSSLPAIVQKIKTLYDVGLGYIALGQPSPTLSGGEAQRIKLAKELCRPSTGKTFYILDEPTTGLHFYDIRKLSLILQALVDRGNTVLVIEHNTDLIKTADWIIELGPEGGDAGGQLLAEGPPEEIIRKKTATGLALSGGFTHRHEAASQEAVSSISVRGACQNNLKNVDAKIPRGKITLCTGPSGSGKTSLAFETIYAEGQRRYIESLSPYARQFVKQMPKPKVEEIEGLSPAIAIEQKNHAGNPRSTVGTMTEAYDYLRILYAHLGTPYSPETGEEIRAISKEYVVEKLLSLPEKSRLQILSPLALKKESFTEILERLSRQGYLRIRLNGSYCEVDQEISFDAGRKNELFVVVDRLIVSPESRSRLFEAVERASELSGGTLTVDCDGKDLFFNLAFADPSTGKSYQPLSPHTFSFNTEQGMCPDCLGLGVTFGADLTRHKELLKLSASDLIHLLWKEEASRAAFSLFDSVLEEQGIDPDMPLAKLSSSHLQLLFNGTIEYKKKGLSFRWLGLNHVLAKAAKSSSELKEVLNPLLDEAPCLSCYGTRLNALARHVKLNHLTIAAFCRLPLAEAAHRAADLSPPPFLEEAHRQLLQRLHFLNSIGLGYLSLDRSAPTLSGGETQRIRLARQLGSGLTGCLYVLDEPTIGLHPHDNERLNKALLRLKEMGNTLLLVEHDPLTMAIADYILDFGPGAGTFGGKIMARGTLAEITANPESLTGAYLNGRKKIPLPEKRRKPSAFYPLKNCSAHNLKNFDAAIPIGLFTCVTGVSGSGKSSLIHDVLKPSVAKEIEKEMAPFDKMIVIDQNPIGQTIRADVTTYVDLSSPLRSTYASLPAAKAKGLQPKHFSPNHRRGMCPSCWGLGVKSVRLQFLPPVKVTCDACQGFRLNPVSLTVSYKGKNFGEALGMTVLEAKEFFGAIPKVNRLLDTLISVGLGYLKLGQEIATLSGGEQQRIRLSRELAKRATGKTLYLLDEPTVGLHSDDIVKLLAIFQSLVDKGNTLVIIEHNLDLIRSADHLIDLGPEAGAKGGFIVAEGTPEEVAENEASVTGRYLKK